MAALSHADLIDILGSRWDATSANAVAEVLLAEAGLSPSGTYSQEQVARVIERLSRRRDHVDYVLSLLRPHAGHAVARPPEPPKAAPPPPPPAPPPAPAPEAAKPPAEPPKPAAESSQPPPDGPKPDTAPDTKPEDEKGKKNGGKKAAKAG